MSNPTVSESLVGTRVLVRDYHTDSWSGPGKVVEVDAEDPSLPVKVVIHEWSEWFRYFKIADEEAPLKAEPGVVCEIVDDKYLSNLNRGDQVVILAESTSSLFLVGKLPGERVRDLEDIPPECHLHSKRIKPLCWYQKSTKVESKGSRTVTRDNLKFDEFYVYAPEELGLPAGTFGEGSIIKLSDDDGTMTPLFELVRGEVKHGLFRDEGKSYAEIPKLRRPTHKELEGLFDPVVQPVPITRDTLEWDKYYVYVPKEFGDFGNIFSEGSIVKLHEDDKSTSPKFELIKGENRVRSGDYAYAELRFMREATSVELASAGIADRGSPLPEPEEQTVCQQMGYHVGDYFMACSNDQIYKLAYDDGSTVPAFYVCRDGKLDSHYTYAHLAHLRKMLPMEVSELDSRDITQSILVSVRGRAADVRETMDRVQDHLYSSLSGTADVYVEVSDVHTNDN